MSSMPPVVGINSPVMIPHDEVVTMDSLKSVLKPYTTVLKGFEQIGDTPFRLNAMNGIYGPAKTGKTTKVLEILNDIDPKYKVVWLDGDRNAALQGKFTNITHQPLSNTEEAILALINMEERLDNYILIIDSFKDFAFGYNIDSNAECQKVFSIYQQLLDKGATLVIIFHATKIRTDGKISGFKIKGNEDTIESKMDFLYKFERMEEFVKLTVQCSRDPSLPRGQELIYGDLSILKDRIKKYLSDNPNCSLRDLKRAPGLSSYKDEIKKLENKFFVVESIQGEGRGRSKKIVKLMEPNTDIADKIQ